LKYGLHHIFNKSRSHLKILSTLMVTCNKFHIEDVQKLCSTIQNLVTTATWSRICAPLVYVIVKKEANSVIIFRQKHTGSSQLLRYVICIWSSCYWF